MKQNVWILKVSKDLAALIEDELEFYQAKNEITLTQVKIAVLERNEEEPCITFSPVHQTRKPKYQIWYEVTGSTALIYIFDDKMLEKQIGFDIKGADETERTIYKFLRETIVY